MVRNNPEFQINAGGGLWLLILDSKKYLLRYMERIRGACKQRRRLEGVFKTLGEEERERSSTWREEHFLIFLPKICTVSTASPMTADAINTRGTSAETFFVSPGSRFAGGFTGVLSLRSSKQHQLSREPVPSTRGAEREDSLSWTSPVLGQEHPLTEKGQPCMRIRLPRSRFSLSASLRAAIIHSSLFLLDSLKNLRLLCH